MATLGMVAVVAGATPGMTADNERWGVDPRALGSAPSPETPSPPAPAPAAAEGADGATPKTMRASGAPPEEDGPATGGMPAPLPDDPNRKPPAPPKRDENAAPIELTLEGTIRIVGTSGQPLPVLRLKADAGTTGAAPVEYVIVGPLASELAALNAMGVSVRGSLGDDPVPPTQLRPLTVTDYDVTDAGGGVAPHVGILEKTDDGVLRINSGKGARGLTGAAAHLKMLAPLVGAKIWLVGTMESDGRIRVGRYGVIRPKPTK